MNILGPTSRITVLTSRKQRATPSRLPATIEDPRQPHCADHTHFMAGCAVCRQACANFQPYPLKKDLPSSRSFGFTDNITAEKLKSLDPKHDYVYDTDPEISWSLLVIRFILRLIWPFSRIL